MHDYYLLLTPLLVFGIFGLVRFVGCDLVFGIALENEWFLDNYVFGTVRNNYSGFVGMEVEIGAKSLEVKELARWCIANSTGAHTLKIIDASTGMAMVNGVASVSLTDKPEGWVIAKLQPSVTLTAGQRYYIVSEEVAMGDSFYDNDTAVIPISTGTVTSAVYSDAGSNQWNRNALPGHSFGPVDFLHKIPD